MKKIFLLLFLFTISYNFGQDKLIFNKKFTQSEDKWIAFKPDSIGVHYFGFIYIDSQAGLTLDFAGTFTIDSIGKYILKKNDSETSIKHRLQPNNVLVAFIPKSHFEELEITEFPDWLKNYKKDENTIERLFNWGYRYNGWSECEIALKFLNKANEINPDYKGLRVELAFSYNCLGQYQKAIDVLKLALEKEPNDAYINKELLYAQVQNNQLKDAIATYEKIIKKVQDKQYNSENAFNILGAYYKLKDVKKFNAWIKKTNVDKDKRLGPYVEQLKKEMSNL
uniref:tetratricopeptide repeat protein n=1 Tax=Flavobacterium sp. TaxID=239 RepID=UPI0040490CB9